MACFNKAADAQGVPDEGALRWYSALLLPAVYASSAHVQEWRAAFMRNLARIEGEAASGQLVLADPARVEGVPQYYLSYHGEPSDVSTYRRLAHLFRRVSAAANVTYASKYLRGYVPPSASAGERVRVGFVSLFFRQHSVSKILAGLLRHLNAPAKRATFEVVLFNLGVEAEEDDMSRLLFSWSRRVVSLGGKSLGEMQRIIALQELDVLVYTGIGMDPASYALAHARLAPWQLLMHGHAASSGIPTIDYFVSYASSYASFAERTASVQKYFSERVIILPGVTPLSLYYSIAPPPPASDARARAGGAGLRQRLGIPAHAIIYGCMQTLYKISPAMDSAFRDILAAHPEAVLLLKELPYTPRLGKQVLHRLARTMAPDLMARVMLLPPLSNSDYLGVQALIDVTLDSFPCGGHTTTMDSLAAHSPVVTLPHTLASGRGSLAFLTALQLSHLIAVDVHHYVSIALQLGRSRLLCGCGCVGVCMCVFVYVWVYVCVFVCVCVCIDCHIYSLHRPLSVQLQALLSTW